MTDRIRLFEIDCLDLEKRKIPLAILRRANFPLNRIACAKTEAADLAWRDVNIVRPGQIVRFRRTQKTKAVRQHFKDAASIDGDIVVGQLLENREHHVLLSQGACVLDFEFLGICEEIGRRFLFQFLKMHGFCTLVGAGYVGQGPVLNNVQRRDFFMTETWRSRQLDCRLQSGGLTVPIS